MYTIYIKVVLDNIHLFIQNISIEGIRCCHLCYSIVYTVSLISLEFRITLLGWNLTLIKNVFLFYLKLLNNGMHSIIWLHISYCLKYKLSIKSTGANSNSHVIGDGHCIDFGSLWDFWIPWEQHGTKTSWLNSNHFLFHAHYQKCRNCEINQMLTIAKKANN